MMERFGELFLKLVAGNSKEDERKSLENSRFSSLRNLAPSARKYGIARELKPNLQQPNASSNTVSRAIHSLRGPTSNLPMKGNGEWRDTSHAVSHDTVSLNPVGFRPRIMHSAGTQTSAPYEDGFQVRSRAPFAQEATRQSYFDRRSLKIFGKKEPFDSQRTNIYTNAEEFRIIRERIIVAEELNQRELLSRRKAVIEIKSDDGQNFVWFHT